MAIQHIAADQISSTVFFERLCGAYLSFISRIIPFASQTVMAAGNSFIQSCSLMCVLFLLHWSSRKLQRTGSATLGNEHTPVTFCRQVLSHSQMNRHFVIPNSVHRII